MAGVYDENVTCPVCGGNFAYFNLETRTNEQEISCARCGFFYQTEVVEVSGITAWKTTEIRPISRDKKRVAMPHYADGPIGNTDGPKWNSHEFPVLPKFNEIPAVFGAVDANEAEQKERNVVDVNPHTFEEL